MEIPFYIIVFDVLLVVLFIGIAINVSIIKDSFSSYSYNKYWHSKFYFLISIGEEQYRPMENYDGVVDRSSSGIQDDLIDIVDIPVNTIARYMKELGYKVVMWHGYAYWNMHCTLYDEEG